MPTASLPQTLTPYHAKYYAYELTRRCPPDSDDRLASALVDAQVDLNPHQIDAALFSFKSPLSRGVLLADEVGLGKTIEAGLVLAQRWAERKRRVLVITPSNLRKQWHQELTDKFFLPCRILEAKSYNDAIKAGHFRPFEADGHVVICSYQFARNKAADVHNTAWDLVVMDEAHRLRNVYKPSNVIANALKQALASAPKLLLTATLLQNSLLELFGLVSIIDDQVFGDLKSFREQFSDLTQEQVFATLKRRLAPICHGEGLARGRASMYQSPGVGQRRSHQLRHDGRHVQRVAASAFFGQAPDNCIRIHEGCGQERAARSWQLAQQPRLGDGSAHRREMVPGSTRRASRGRPRACQDEEGNSHEGAIVQEARPIDERRSASVGRADS